MMRKKTRKAPFYLAAMGICAAIFSGCGNSMQTEEELVIPRADGMEGGTGTGANGAETFGTGQTEPMQGIADNVAAQVQAPERYQAEISDENILIHADAELDIPDVPGIRTKKVEARFFTQEDYDTVNTVLFDGGKLWDRDYEAMADTHGFTLSELKGTLERLEAEKASGVDGDAPYGDKPETLNQRIERYQKLLEAAEAKGMTDETEPMIKEIPAIIEQDSELSDDWFQLSGFVTAKGEDYSVYLLNHMDGEWMWTLFSAEKADGRGNYIYYGDFLNSSDEAEKIKEKTGSVQIQPEEILTTAAEVLEQMGMDDFTVQGGEYFASYQSVGNDGETEVDRIGYGVHAIRMVEGVPVRYTHQNGSGSTTDESVCWQYEEMTLIYDEEGLAAFSWSDPYTISDLSAEYVFLLPFSDIRNIFEEMTLKKKKDGFSEEGDSMEINIDRVCLNYMRVREKNSTEGTLIPVWDFFGTQTYRKSSGEVFYIQDSDYESILTINAMDGTVINREFGY